MPISSVGFGIKQLDAFPNTNHMTVLDAIFGGCEPPTQVGLLNNLAEQHYIVYACHVFSVFSKHFS